MAKIKNAPLPPGYKVGRYRIQKKLAAGGFGVVYLASRADGEIVALKEFLPSIFSCRPQGTAIKLPTAHEEVRFSQGLASFFKEADTLAKLQSDRVIPVWDVFKENGTAYFAMPLERGGTLQAMIKFSKRQLSEIELRHLFVEACRGVEFLHENGLLHLDIKPSNLWVRPDRSVLVLDLGASRWEDDEVKNSQMARTPGFAAPEQHSGLRKESVSVSPKTDIYGLCASFLSCLIGHPPTPAPERKPFHPPSSWTRLGRSSPRLLAVLEQGMRMTPALRQKNVAELRSQLESIPRLSSSVFGDEKLTLPWRPTH